MRPKLSKHMQCRHRYLHVRVNPGLPFVFSRVYTSSLHWTPIVVINDAPISTNRPLCNLIAINSFHFFFGKIFWRRIMHLLSLFPRPRDPPIQLSRSACEIILKYLWVLLIYLKSTLSQKIIPQDKIQNNDIVLKSM